MEIYSALKAPWHTQDIDALRRGNGIVPSHLYLIISDRCNQDCHFCTYRSSSGWGSEKFGADDGRGFTMNPNRRISKEKCFEIIDDCAELGVKALQFTGGVEPTVHPDHVEIFRYALDAGLQCGLVTNGTNIPKGVVGRFSWVRVSVDAGRRETYELTRKSKLWGKVLDNLAELVSVQGPTVGASFVCTRENFLEVVDFCKIMKGLGVPYVKISANLTTEGLGYYDGILDAIMGLMAEAKQLADGTFKIANVFDRRLQDLRIGRPTHAFCGQQRFAGYIGGDLRVYRCCNTAYTTHGEIGDLSQQRYKDWLLNQSPEKFDTFDARSCEFCQFHEKNEAVAYLVQERPPHVDCV